jgi:hypothetical protein
VQALSNATDPALCSARAHIGALCR